MKIIGLILGLILLIGSSIGNLDSIDRAVGLLLVFGYIYTDDHSHKFVIELKKHENKDVSLGIIKRNKRDKRKSN